MEHRLAAIRAKMSARGLDALLITSTPNVRYLSGFPDEGASLIITADRACIATDFRYLGVVKAMSMAAPVTWELVETTYTRALPQAASDVVRAAGAARLGFEEGNVTYAAYRELRRALADGRKAAVRLVPASGLVEGLRAVKDPTELAAIERAVAVADQALADVLATLRSAPLATMSERQVAWLLERRMRELGAEGMAFDVTVAGGPNSAVPHHSSGDRLLGSGEPIWIDMGARVDGYCSDITRSFCLGEPDARFREIYDIVLRAQLAAAKAVRAGVRGTVPHQAAHKVIDDTGYQAAFRHGTGHGIGLKVHESPWLGSIAKARLQSGNVVSVEPGIYLEGWGGIRIEDLVAVTDQGCRVLTKSPK